MRNFRMGQTSIYFVKQTIGHLLYVAKSLVFFIFFKETLRPLLNYDLANETLTAVNK